MLALIWLLKPYQDYSVIVLMNYTQLPIHVKGQLVWINEATSRCKGALCAEFFWVKNVDFGTDIRLDSIGPKRATIAQHILATRRFTHGFLWKELYRCRAWHEMDPGRGKKKKMKSSVMQYHTAENDCRPFSLPILTKVMPDYTTR